MKTFFLLIFFLCIFSSVISMEKNAESKTSSISLVCKNGCQLKLTDKKLVEPFLGSPVIFNMKKFCENNCKEYNKDHLIWKTPDFSIDEVQNVPRIVGAHNSKKQCIQNFVSQSPIHKSIDCFRVIDYFGFDKEMLRLGFFLIADKLRMQSASLLVNDQKLQNSLAFLPNEVSNMAARCLPNYVIQFLSCQLPSKPTVECKEENKLLVQTKTTCEVDSDHILVGMADGTIILQNIKTNEEIKRLKKHSVGIQMLQKINQHYFLSRALNGELKIWDIATEKTYPFEGVHEEDPSINAKVFCIENGYLYACLFDSNNLMRYSLKALEEGYVALNIDKIRYNGCGINVSDDGRLVALYTTEDPFVQIYNAENCKLISKLLIKDGATIRKVFFMPSSVKLLIQTPKSIQLWDLNDTKRLNKFELPHIDFSSFFTITSDSRYLFTTDTSCGYSSTLCMWDIESGLHIKEFLLPDLMLRKLYISKDNKKVIAETDEKKYCFIIKDEWIEKGMRLEDILLLKIIQSIDISLQDLEAARNLLAQRRNYLPKKVVELFQKRMPLLFQ